MVRHSVKLSNNMSHSYSKGLRLAEYSYPWLYGTTLPVLPLSGSWKSQTYSLFRAQSIFDRLCRVSTALSIARVLPPSSSTFQKIISTICLFIVLWGAQIAWIISWLRKDSAWQDEPPYITTPTFRDSLFPYTSTFRLAFLFLPTHATTSLDMYGDNSYGHPFAPLLGCKPPKHRTKGHPDRVCGRINQRSNRCLDSNYNDDLSGDGNVVTGCLFLFLLAHPCESNLTLVTLFGSEESFAGYQ